MKKRRLCELIQNILKEIRNEYELSQEVMADTIGVSKKTYIQLEKDRIPLRWAETVTVCTLFSDSKIITEHFGKDIIEILQVVAFQKMQKRQLPTLGGTVWWDNILSTEEYTLQQHKISKHYRILDKDHFRLFFTLSKSEADNRFNRYIGTVEKGEYNENN